MMTTMKEAWRRLDERGAPATIGTTAAEVLDFSAHEGQRLQAQMTRVGNRYWNTYGAWYGEPPESRIPVARHYLTVTGNATATAAAGLCMLEMIAGSLTTGFAVGVAHRTMGALVGAAVALLTAVIAAGIGVAAVGKYEERPLAARRILHRALVVLGVPWAICLVLVLATRTVPAAELVAIFPVALAALMLLSPALGAVCAALSKLYGWSRRMEREWTAAEMYARDLVRLATHAQRIERAAARRFASALPAAGRWTVWVGMVLTLAALAGGPARAQDAPGVVARDQSESVDAAGLIAADKAVVTALPHLTLGRRVTSWSLVPFTDDAFVAELIAVVPGITATRVSCSVGGEAEWLFNSLRRARAAECAKARATSASLIDQILLQRAEVLAAALARLKPRPSACTALRDLLLRATMLPPGSTVVVETDGANSCASSTALLPHPAAGTRVIVVLVPSRGGAAARSADALRARERALRKLAPWIEVAYAWSLSQMADAS